MRTARIVVVVGLALAGGAASAKVDMTGKKEHAQANCPSAVPGATTKVTNVRDGVEVTVTADDPKAQAEIQKRAHRQEQLAMQTARGAIEHTGEGTGSGRFGFCPGMIQDTRVSAVDLPDGAKLVVHANRPGQVGELQKMTKRRAEAIRVQR